VHTHFSNNLFWDVSYDDIDFENHAGFIVQRVLEFGDYQDWLLLKEQYGLDKIVSLAKQVRSLFPEALSFICAISHTRPEEYRCYTQKQWYQIP